MSDNINNKENCELQFFKYDPKVPYPTIILGGKRFSGKSTAGFALAEIYSDHIPRWAAFCGTKETEDDWADSFESSASVYGPDAKGRNALRRLIQYQQRKARFYKRFLKQPFPDEYNLGLVFDDVTSKKEFRKGEILEDLFSNGRHYKTVIIISCQWIRQLPPPVRTNSDYIGMLHMTKQTCEIMWNEFIEFPEEFRMFLELHRLVTGKKDEKTGEKLFYALWFDNTSSSTELDQVFKIFATPPGFDCHSVKVGAKSWREYNKKNYLDKEMEMFAKEHRRQERMKRLETYRKQQQERRKALNANNPSMNVELDYLSDSDDDEEEESDEDADTKKTNKHTISGRNSSFQVRVPMMPVIPNVPLQKPLNNQRTPFTSFSPSPFTQSHQSSSSSSSPFSHPLQQHSSSSSPFTQFSQHHPQHHPSPFTQFSHQPLQHSSSVQFSHQHSPSNQQHSTNSQPFHPQYPHQHSPSNQQHSTNSQPFHPQHPHQHSPSTHFSQPFHPQHHHQHSPSTHFSQPFHPQYPHQHSPSTQFSQPFHPQYPHQQSHYPFSHQQPPHPSTQFSHQQHSTHPSFSHHRSQNQFA